MATLGRADVVLVPKFEGLTAAVEKQLKEVEGRYQSSGGKSGDGFSKGLLSSSASFGVFSNLASRAMDTVSAHVGDAVARFDTLNNYPKVMQSLGYSADDADRSISAMSDRLSTLPTRLDDMASTVQGLSVITGDLDQATEAGLALNDMLLASGSSTQLTTAAMEQFRQMLSKGKPEMEDWKSLTSAMPGQMDQLAKSMLGPTANANDLYAALGGGKNQATISMDELLNEIIRLDKEGGEGFASFRDQAETASGGIATSMANTANAVTKGIAGTLDAIGKENIAGAFNGVKSAINDAFGAINGVVRSARPAIDQIGKSLGGLAPSALTAVAAFAGFKTVGSTLVNVSSKMAAVAEEGFSLASVNGALGTSFSPVTLGITAAAAVAGVLASAYIESRKRSDDLRSATDGLDEAVSRSTALDDYTATIEKVGEGAGLTAKSVDKLAESTARHVQSIEEINAKAEEQIATLNSVQGIIDESVGKTDLSAEAQGRLEWALKTLNEQMGLNITKNDVLNGQYVDADGNVKNLKESIDGLIESKKAEARAAALTDSLTEAYQVQTDAAKTLAQARQDYNDEVEWFMRNVEGITRADAEYRASQGETGRALESAKGQYDSAAGAVKNLESELGLQTAATTESATELERWAGSTSELFRASLEASGTSVSMLCEDLAGLGADTNALSSLTEEQLLSIADSYDGTAASVAQKLSDMGVSIENYNYVELEDKDASVAVSHGSMTNALDEIHRWNSMGSYLGKKVGEVVTSVTKVVSERRNAAGGIRLNAAGGYRTHADGAIATRAVPLDIVGEDGAEAIVPLTNRRYSQPFADLIAEGVGNRVRGGSTYNVYLDGRALHVADKVADAMERFVEVVVSSYE